MSVTARTTTLARLVLALAMLVFAIVAAVPAGAAEQPPPLLNGVYITGATVKTPGQPDRKLDADQATAFMQAWLPASVFEHLPNSNPPKSLPVTHLDVSTTWNEHPIKIVVVYATDGTHAWVGMPGPQSLGWAVVSEDKWIEAPESPRLMQAFAGKLSPVTSPTTTSTTVPATKSASPATNGSSSSFPWVGFVIVLVVIAGIVLVLVRMRVGRSGARASADSGARK